MTPNQNPKQCEQQVEHPIHVPTSSRSTSRPPADTSGRDRGHHPAWGRTTHRSRDQGTAGFVGRNGHSSPCTDGPASDTGLSSTWRGRSAVKTLPQTAHSISIRPSTAEPDLDLVGGGRQMATPSLGYAVGRTRLV